ncbi:MAG: hypothetical protein H6Q14_2560 [Bacteroidetes bacterium]|nr:hypothetical protein [Bacteroidota bacterium]
MMPFIPICLKTVALYDFIIPIYKLAASLKQQPNETNGSEIFFF